MRPWFLPMICMSGKAMSGGNKFSMSHIMKNFKSEFFPMIALVVKLKKTSLVKVMSVNLKSNLWSPGFSQKNRTKLTILSILLTQDSEFRLFFGRIQETINCFRDLLTFSNYIV
jgi:hypothetical protein